MDVSNRYEKEKDGYKRSVQITTVLDRILQRDKTKTKLCVCVCACVGGAIFNKLAHAIVELVCPKFTGQAS
jgi:hypothetical protein